MTSTRVMGCLYSRREVHMFAAFPSSNATFRGFPAWSCFRSLRFLLILSLAFTACQSLSHLPAVDLKQPGWTVREGQAVWTRQRGAPEIAGEIVVATQLDGRAFVQFSKNGFPLLLAQSTPHEWSVELPTENKHYSGGGAPPKRLMLLYLPSALRGGALPRGWKWQHLDNNSWRLENASNGESLEGYFTQ